MRFTLRRESLIIRHTLTCYMWFFFVSICGAVPDGTDMRCNRPPFCSGSVDGLKMVLLPPCYIILRSVHESITSPCHRVGCSVVRLPLRVLLTTRQNHQTNETISAFKTQNNRFGRTRQFLAVFLPIFKCLTVCWLVIDSRDGIGTTLASRSQKLCSSYNTYVGKPESRQA